MIHGSCLMNVKGNMLIWMLE